MIASRRRSRFIQQVDGWVLDAVDSGASSFDEILISLPGVYPTDLIRSVERLRSRGELRALDRLEAPSATDTSYATPLPIPHLLDYDWRFTPETARHIANRCLNMSRMGDHLLFIGTPTSALAASDGKAPRRLTLLESNAATASVARNTRRIAVLRSNALRLSPTGARADILVLDPPWYRDYLHSFLNVAAAWSSPGSKVLLAVPPLGTRPEVGAEHRELEMVCKRLGLQVIQTDSAALRYVTPPFEINALMAHGLRNVHPTWRRGDLWLLEKVEDKDPNLRVRPQEPRWVDCSVFGIRIKIRPNVDSQSSPVDPRLISLTDGDVCPAVSRNHPLRAQAQVWTSGNRVFGCLSPEALIPLVESAARPRDAIDHLVSRQRRPLTASEEAFTSRALSQVRRIAALEREELTTWRHEYGGVVPARHVS